MSWMAFIERTLLPASFSRGEKAAIARRVRELSPRTYIVWGGIHPIIHPEDAIAADVDAVSTGEGEFAFHEFFEAFGAGRDFTATRNFWFKTDDGVKRNGFLPLQTPAELEWAFDYEDQAGTTAVLRLRE